MKVGLIIVRACQEINTKQRFNFRFKCGGCEAPVWPVDTMALLHYVTARVPLFLSTPSLFALGFIFSLVLKWGKKERSLLSLYT